MTSSIFMNIETFLQEYAPHPHYRAPHGTQLHTSNWQTEAALRMLLNNLSPEVAENPKELVVYGGNGQAARTPEDVHKILRALVSLTEDESLLVQSGKAVGIIRSHPEAPRVLIANSNLVPHWADWKTFNDLKSRGLIMFGQMTAGSWMYIGSQGILQGTYETFAEAARKYLNGTLAGKLVVSGGLGGMGGAQPLAATLNGGVFLGVDINPASIQKRLEMGYINRMTLSYEEARDLVLHAKKEKKPLSVGLVADIGTILNRLISDCIIPDLLTDQTSAHDPLNGYIPSGYSIEAAASLRKEHPEKYTRLSIKSMAEHLRAMLILKSEGSVTFEYGNNLRAFALQGGVENAFEIPGFVPEYIRPLFCEGKGPFRWVALSGDPKDILTTDEALAELFPQNRHLIHWLQMAQKHVAFQGLPARICWLGMGEREKAGLLFNQLVKAGRVKAPIAIGRDHLDAGSVASPHRETESMKDGSDAISDWPLLNLMSNCVGGATWCSFHHGGGVGMGYSQHAGMVVVADGTERAERCLKRVLYNDPATGIIRHADAGYETSVNLAKQYNLLP